MIVFSLQLPLVPSNLIASLDRNNLIISVSVFTYVIDKNMSPSVSIHPMREILGFTIFSSIELVVPGSFHFYLKKFVADNQDSSMFKTLYPLSRSSSILIANCYRSTSCLSELALKEIFLTLLYFIPSFSLRIFLTYLGVTLLSFCVLSALLI